MTGSYSKQVEQKLITAPHTLYQKFQPSKYTYLVKVGLLNVLNPLV